MPAGLTTQPFAVHGTRSEVLGRKRPTAVFADVHGNLPALEAVVSDAIGHGAELLVCAGDVVGYGPWPRACIDFLREAEISVVRGNYDTGVGLGLSDCGCAYATAAEQASGPLSLAWTQAMVDDSHRRWLAELPDIAEVTSEEGAVLAVIFHGSPRRVNEYLYADRPLASLERLFAGQKAPVTVCAHTHLPYQRALSDGRILVNCGSAGRPKHGRPTASYAMLSWSKVEPQAHGALALPAVELREVPYDHHRTARAVLASGLPADFAALITTGGAK